MLASAWGDKKHRWDGMFIEKIQQLIFVLCIYKFLELNFIRFLINDCAAVQLQAYWIYCTGTEQDVHKPNTSTTTGLWFKGGYLLKGMAGTALFIVHIEIKVKAGPLSSLLKISQGCACLRYLHSRRAEEQLRVLVISPTPLQQSRCRACWCMDYALISRFISTD